MPTLPSGLQINPFLTTRQAKTLEFEPSIGFMARRVNKLGADIRSFKEPLLRSIKYMGSSFDMNFQKGGRPEKWQDLADETWKKKRGKILDETGALRKAVKQLNIWTVSRDSAFVNDLPDKVWYGKVHQQGWGGQQVTVPNIGLGGAGQTTTVTADLAEGGIPQRRFIMMQDEDIIIIERIFTDYLGERVLANGFRGTRGIGG